MCVCECIVRLMYTCELKSIYYFFPFGIKSTKNMYIKGERFCGKSIVHAQTGFPHAFLGYFV